MPKEKLRIKVDGVITHIRSLTFTEQRGVSICPLCRKEIKAPNKAYLLINNYKLFPNVLIHKGCIFNSWEGIIIQLKNDYESAKMIRKRNRCWFKDED